MMMLSSAIQAFSNYNGFMYILDEQGLPVMGVTNHAPKSKTDAVYEQVKQADQSGGTSA